MQHSMLGRFPRRAVLIGAVAALTALVAATVAQAGLALKKGAPTDETLIIRQGQTIGIDPLTGRIQQPTREEAVALAQQMLGQYHSSVAPVVHTSSSGLMWANLPEDFQEVMVLRLLPDGTTSVECVHGPLAADDIVLRGDLPQADCEMAKVPVAAPTAAIEKASTPTAPRAAATSARTKSIRKSAKPASVSTVRR